MFTNSLCSCRFVLHRVKFPVGYGVSRWSKSQIIKDRGGANFKVELFLILAEWRRVGNFI